MQPCELPLRYHNFTGLPARSLASINHDMDPLLQSVPTFPWEKPHAYPLSTLDNRLVQADLGGETPEPPLSRFAGVDTPADDHKLEEFAAFIGPVPLPEALDALDNGDCTRGSELSSELVAWVHESCGGTWERPRRSRPRWGPLTVEKLFKRLMAKVGT